MSSATVSRMEALDHASGDDRVATFRRLHASGCFVMPNPWDVGSARALEQLGFKALATTSAGFAWTLGRADNQVTLDQALEHLRVVADAVKVPVNADFEGGFAVDPEHVGANVKLAAATGIAGLSIEDSTGDAADPLHDFDLAVERVRAARQAIDESGTGIVLTGRSEGFVVRTSRHRRDDPKAARLRRSRRRLPLRSADRLGRARRRDRRRGVTQTGEPADQRSVHDGRRGGGARSTADQRGGHARAHRVGWIPAGRERDRRRGDASPGSSGCRTSMPCFVIEPTDADRSLGANLCKATHLTS